MAGSALSNIYKNIIIVIQWLVIQWKNETVLWEFGIGGKQGKKYYVDNLELSVQMMQKYVHVQLQ